MRSNGLDQNALSSIGSSKVLIDPDLNRNAIKYRDNHIHKDAVEIMLHFINGKYRNMLTTRNGNKPARAMVAYL